ncbi:homoserine dehydrogenase [Oxobacter pfennigii]|uniref:Homoserine dehydrogenase n=1 Tax=Oxobacter pfennigii TaxID=36849 RepID=A0A0P8WAM2_9CLOT|nr:homoserine dehydrogenase [Oxobacter pfennigii]KPU44763.1 homoserine dehydrogenase [Oxobacter pfennigii]
MRIALIGYGNVGKAFLKLLCKKEEYLKAEGIDIKVNYVVSSKGGVYNPDGINIKELDDFIKTEKDITKYHKGGGSDVSFSTVLKNKDVNTVIETTTTNKETGEPGMTHITLSLESGFNVVVSNKGPIMLAYKKLYGLAKKNNVQLGIGCTTGGALPSINGGIIELAGAEIMSIEGVLNGTTNYILNEMEKGETTYEEALKNAQSLGIAEADPTMDVEGWDTATKLLILTNVLMNKENTLNDIEVEGITSITPKMINEALKQGKKYKLIGKTINKDGEVNMSVRLELLGSEHPLYSVDGKNKSIRYVSNTLGDLIISGGASGLEAAAASVLRDLINIYRGYKYVR